jgi:hypothetical protein
MMGEKEKGKKVKGRIGYMLLHTMKNKTNRMGERESGRDHFPYVIGDLSLVIDGAIHCAMTNDIGKMT